MSALFKEIHLEYIATYQNQNSTQSATLFLALYDSQNNIVFEVNMPEPNRQLIALKKSGSFSDVVYPITPIPISPIILPKRISFTGTHGITLAANKSIDTDNKVNYSITGEYIDAKGDKEPFSTPSRILCKEKGVKGLH